MARITLLGPAWPYRGGIAHFQASLARTLATRGHDVSQVTFRRQYPGRLFPGTSQLDDGAEPDEPAPRLIDSLGPASWWRTAREVAASGTEVAVFMHWMPFFGPAFGTIARRLQARGVTVLAVVHNALPHERRPGDHVLTRYALGACDGLVVMSEQVRSDLGRLDIDGPIQQVEHPVYDVFGPATPKAQARAALALDPDAPTFLFFGFIRRYKGLHVLLDAWPAVCAAVPDAQLVVAGEFYADEDALRAQVAALGGEAGGVRLDAEYIADDRVGLYVSAADAVVQPYLSATQSGVAQVAFHFERPVVTTDVGGLAEVVPDGVAGLVVPPDDAPALAAALVRFADEGLAERLAPGVARQRARFSWDRVAEAVEALAGNS
ncbi:glycosyltransferase [Rubrivirga sp. IMCC43871]|uniref:glycosyltransferase n=1 Tax=Rubrivirga sp. IMCC43871 TaxID=3391575 RepID=UPI00399011E3